MIGSGPQAAERRAAWVKGAIVDGAAVTAAKRAALSAMATAVGRSGIGRETALRNFMFERPDLVEYARFRAAVDRFGIDWHTWPGPLRAGLLRWSDVDPVNERYHVYAQWVAHEQMAELSERLSQRGQVLALDLPVGIHPCGYDVWRHREQYATGMSVGAPPDGFFAQGQSWGFPPTRPEALRADGHEEFRAALAHHLRVAGMLRIDHIMGLQRLFWIPAGAEPRDGVYVKMPFEELLAVVTIEAQRHRADIIGEDLGTVDEKVRRGMEERASGVRTSRSSPSATHGEPMLETPPAGSCRLVLDPRPAHAHRLVDRTRHRRAPRVRPAGRLVGRGGPGGKGASAGTPLHARSRRARCRRDTRRSTPRRRPPRCSTAIHAELARSEAGLVLVQLDDLVGQPDSVNLPGTSTERPNWNRLTNATLEQIVRGPGAARSAGTAAREPGAGLARLGRPPGAGSRDRAGCQPARLRSTSTCSTKGGISACTRSSAPTR